MATTPLLGLFYPNTATDGANPFNTDTMLRDNWVTIDALFNGTTGHTHDGTAGKGPKLTSAAFATGAVNAAALGPNSVTAAAIADGAVGSTELAAGAVTSTAVANGAILNAALGPGAVTANKITDATITGQQIAAATIQSGNLAPDSVTSAKILDGAVTDAEIGNRTMVDTVDPTAGAQTLSNNLSMLAAAIKAIKGLSSWATDSLYNLETLGSRVGQGVNVTDTPTFAGVRFVNPSNNIRYIVTGGRYHLDTVGTVYWASANPPNYSVNAFYDGTNWQRNSALNASAVVTIPLTGGLQVKRAPAASGNIVFNMTTKIAEETTEDVTLYVRPGGNDNNRGNVDTDAGALRTVAKALSMIPRTVNHQFTINVAGGSQPQDTISLRGYGGGGTILIQNSTFGSAAVTIPYVEVISTTVRVEIKGMTASRGAGEAFNAINSPNVNYWNCNAVVTATGAGFAYYNSMGNISGCTTSGRDPAVYSEGSRVYVINLGGSANVMAFYASYGGVILAEGTVPLATTPQGITRGGKIILTANGPTRIRAEMGGLPSYDVAPGSRAIACNGEVSDPLDEYDGLTGVVIPKQAGWYLISTCISYTAVGGGYQDARLNMGGGLGTGIKIGGAIPAAGSNNGVISGSVHVFLQYGQAIYISMFTSTPATITQGNGDTWFSCVRTGDYI